MASRQIANRRRRVLANAHEQTFILWRPEHSLRCSECRVIHMVLIESLGASVLLHCRHVMSRASGLHVHERTKDSWMFTIAKFGVGKKFLSTSCILCTDSGLIAPIITSVCKLFLQTSLNNGAEKIFCATHGYKMTTRFAASVASAPLSKTPQIQFESLRRPAYCRRTQNSIVRRTSRRLNSSRLSGRVGYVVSINS
jgi:hypothetical protein